jgi:16S rRNA (adenine1518-N6/adenine1519-N6)-dimethyltransferase
VTTPALSPSATRACLARLGHAPRHALGQNFLVDGNIVRKSLVLADVGPGDRVVEIGPGLGTLTAALLEAGAEVWAIEKDRVLHAHLQSTLAAEHPSRLHLALGDAVAVPLAGLDRLCDLPFKIVANLPYAIATPWLDAVLEGPLPTRMALMLQHEAAQRYTARHGCKAFGAISIFLQAAYDVGPSHKVSPTCFHPRPDVDSSLLCLVRKPEPVVLSAEAKGLVRACFQQRRKQIGSLLRSRLEGREVICLEHLRAAGFSEQARPEEIPTAVWIGLAGAATSAA